MGLPNKGQRQVNRLVRRSPENTARTRTHVPGNASVKAKHEIWSLFSGAMGLDLGLEDAGLKPTLAVEIDPSCCETIRTHRPDLTLLAEKHGDVTKLHAADLRKARDFDGEVFLMVGGPPCQSFSSGGRRAALSDPRGNLIYEYLRLIGEVRPKFFVLENVANIVTAAVRHREIKNRPGKHWSLKRYNTGELASKGFTLDADELSGTAIRQLLADLEDTELGYNVVFGVLDAADYGAPQHRLRFVMLGSKEGLPPSLPAPTNGPDLKPFETVRNAIEDLQECPGPHSEYTTGVKRFYDLVPAGGTWRSLPTDIQKEALGQAWHAGGGKTGFYRRLGWDVPSPTITGRANRKASGMCHPSATRPLSVRECARLQGFPDGWTFTGAMNKQYMQIGNAVPVALGRAIGGCFVNLKRLPLRHAQTVPNMLEAAVLKLRNSARNKRKPPQQVRETPSGL